MTTIVITGGRTFAHEEALRAALDAIHKEAAVTLLVHGCARGADSLAEEWAWSRGLKSEGHVAFWRAVGKRAGLERNERMIKAHLGARALIAFPGGRGTEHCVWTARRLMVPVFRVTTTHKGDFEFAAEAAFAAKERGIA